MLLICAAIVATGVGNLAAEELDKEKLLQSEEIMDLDDLAEDGELIFDDEEEDIVSELDHE